MSVTRCVIAACAVASVTVVAPATAASPSDAPQAKAKTYKNCTALQRDYPHGVGLPKAKDKTSGTPVTSFKRSKPLYNANKGSDGDGDGIACEKA
jgi:hypothetical protein